jgi:ElaB/YqjD/DUF883 family membrane-anchored ribosome-binding protein
MPEDTDIQPVKNADTPEVSQTTPEETLPEQTPQDVNPTEKMAELEKQFQEAKESWEKEKQKLEDLRAETERRLKDNQEYISRTRNNAKEEPAQSTKPAKTIDDYLEEVAKKFEDDPKEGIKKVVRDLTYDRDLERQDNLQRIAAAEDKAFRRAIMLDPEKGKTLKEIETFDDKNPDLREIPFERKIEWIRMQSASLSKSAANNMATRERDLSLDVGTGGDYGKRRDMPGWVNDPIVLRQAKESGFESKKDLLEWADPQIARIKAERKRPIAV